MREKISVVITVNPNTLILMLRFVSQQNSSNCKIILLLSLLPVPLSPPVTLSPPAVEWSHATGMLTPLLQCLTLWVEQTLTGATQVSQCINYHTASYIYLVHSYLYGAGLACYSMFPCSISNLLFHIQNIYMYQSN